MNTQVEIQLYADGEPGAPGQVQRMFARAEQSLTRFNTSSDLCKLNRSAGRPQRVSALLFDVVETSLWAASATDGVFDPSLLQRMKAIGYDRSFEQIAHSDRPISALPPPRPGAYRGIALDRARGEIYLPPDVQLDLGGIGKGWTVDRAADWLAGKGPFLINAGGDLYAYDAPPGQPGWSIGLADPWQPARDLLRLRVRQRAVATSTTSRRRWQRGGRTLHHLIDPRTGQPAESDVVSVTVVAHRAALAEVFAKTALILGAEAGLAWLHSIPEAEGVLVRDNGELQFTDGFQKYIEVPHDDPNPN
jgi:thiamine biosynthesis lipoprotein